MSEGSNLGSVLTRSMLKAIRVRFRLEFRAGLVRVGLMDRMKAKVQALGWALTSTLALTSGGGSPTVLNIHSTTPCSSGKARNQSLRFNCRRYMTSLMFWRNRVPEFYNR